MCIVGMKWHQAVRANFTVPRADAAVNRRNGLPVVGTLLQSACHPAPQPWQSSDSTRAARSVRERVNWLNAWHALRLAGREPEAAAVLARCVTWVRETSRSHVPFRDSFVRANAINQQLLRAAP
jgi:hypothetical protein